MLWISKIKVYDCNQQIKKAAKHENPKNID